MFSQILVGQKLVSECRISYGTRPWTPNFLVTTSKPKPCVNEGAAWCLPLNRHQFAIWSRERFSGRMWHSIHHCFCTHPSPSIFIYPSIPVHSFLPLSLSGPLWRPWKPRTFRLTMVDFLPAVALSFSLRGLALKHTGATISPPKSHCLAFVAAYWMRMPH